MQPNDSSSIRLDLRHLSAILAIALVGALVYIGLTFNKGKASRTITVTGEATVSAEPDRFVFTPSYEKKAANSTEAISQVSTIGNGVIAKLKELGAEDKDLKTNVSANKQYIEPIVSASEQFIEPRNTESKDITATYQITATISKKELAQKIQDYLATTPVMYSVTPQASFSKEKTKQLQDEIRVKGIADVKGKAESQAKLLGVRLGKVVSVAEPIQYGGPIYAMEGQATGPIAKDTAQVTPTFEIGEQDLSYTVNVVFEIK